MARCAVIDKNNVVVNVVVADPSVDLPPEGMTLVATETAGPGWLWNGAAFADPTPPREPVTPSVPEYISRRQCALMLNLSGLITLEEALDMTKTAAVPAVIGRIFANLAPPDQIKAEINFAAVNYYRDNPLIVDLMQSTGFTPGMTDAFFIAAAKL